MIVLKNLFELQPETKKIDPFNFFHCYDNTRATRDCKKTIGE